MEAADEIFLAHNGRKFGGVRRGALFSVAAEIVVDDPHGDRAASFRPTAGLRLCLGCGAVYLHLVLNALLAIGAVVSGCMDARSRVFSAAGEHI